MHQRRFSAFHTWARLDDDGFVSVGITAHAQDELGELQYVGLPRVGATVRKAAAFGEVESVKTACEVYAPCTGLVVAVNTELVSDPSAINRDPYGAGWMMRVRPFDPGEFESLVDETTYLGLTAAQEPQSANAGVVDSDERVPFLLHSLLFRLPCDGALPVR